MIWFFYQILKVLFLLLFPFILLIRGSVYLYENYNFGSYPSLLGASLFTIFVMFVYFTIFYGKLTGKIGSYDVLKRRAVIVILCVLAYGAHGVLFFSGANMKSESLRAEVLSLHPILRLSLSTIIHIDKDLIITDASRSPEDYRKMGLKSVKNSLHYKQDTGYAHAVDLRVKGRSEIRNRLTQLYFKGMGFNTIRHGGTADHLHISIINKNKPWAK